jgi:hypothetical protein
MDPYHILGVPRDCTREEVKEAFRARAWSAHPDRGGEEPSFIRLCTAYKQILEELDRNPGLGWRKPARGPREGRASKMPVPRWDPELIVLAKPPIPDWNPELIIPDQPPPKAPPPAPSDPKMARTSYVSWLRRVSAVAESRNPTGRWSRFRALGVMILVIWVIVSIAGCWIVWHDVEQMEAEARRASGRYHQGEK